MGHLEESGRRKTRRKNIRSFVLEAVCVAGMLSVALVAPNVLGALGKLGLLPTRRQKEVINRSRDRLLRQGFMERRDGFVRLTAKGTKALEFLKAHEFTTVRPKRWDGKWRVLIFDIPEYRRGVRDKIRHTLGRIGFIRLQDSVWVFPYDCEEFVALLKADFKIGKDILYMIVEELEGDRRLKAHFDIH